jgi:hypothetical protein
VQALVSADTLAPNAMNLYSLTRIGRELSFPPLDGVEWLNFAETWRFVNFKRRPK